MLAISPVSPASAVVLYSNGFEANTVDWSAAATRVGSGTNGVTSATGSFHAVASTGAFTRWGGYNYGAGDSVPTTFQEYWTSVDIYLDPNGGWANDTRFDFDSAINASSGNFLRDFIFNAGYYDAGDLTGPGAGTKRFVISASNNSQPGGAFAKNPGKDPIAISAAGWYTFQDHFYDNGGFLADEKSLYDSTDALVHSWTMTTTDAIGGVGGNRYGWFDYNQFSALPFDNAELSVPEPTSLALLGSGLFGLSRLRRRRR